MFVQISSNQSSLDNICVDVNNDILGLHFKTCGLFAFSHKCGKQTKLAKQVFDIH